MVFALWRRFVLGLATLTLCALWAPGAVAAFYPSWNVPKPPTTPAPVPPTSNFSLDLSKPTTFKKESQSVWTTTVTDGKGTTITVKFTAGNSVVNGGGAKLSWDDSDASIGVITPTAPSDKPSNTDEIDEWEFLNVEFFDANNKPIAVKVTEVVVVDLFYAEKRDYKEGYWVNGTQTYNEKGAYEINGVKKDLNAVAGQTATQEGKLAAPVSTTPTTKIKFFVPNTAVNSTNAVSATTDKREDNDFAFRGVKFQIVTSAVGASSSGGGGGASSSGGGGGASSSGGGGGASSSGGGGGASSGGGVSAGNGVSNTPSPGSSAGNGPSNVAEDPTSSAGAGDPVSQGPGDTSAEEEPEEPEDITPVPVPTTVSSSSPTLPVVVGGVPELSGQSATTPLALLLGAVLVGAGRVRRRR